MLVLLYPTQYTDEERLFATGLIDAKLYTAIITLRGDRIRIISTRRARKQEIELHERLKNANDKSIYQNVNCPKSQFNSLGSKPYSFKSPSYLSIS